MLSRLKNTLVYAVNKRSKLPKYIVIVLDDDLITYLDYCNHGMAAMLGEWIEWIAEQFAKICEKRKTQLPAKAKKDSHPVIYWVAPLQHKNFPPIMAEARSLLTSCIQTVTKTHTNMRIIRMKEIWEYNNSHLVSKTGVITEYGLSKYWLSIDAAIRFNVVRHDLFTAKALLKANPLPQSGQQVDKSAKGTFKRKMKDPMQYFFQKKKDKDRGKYIWSNKNRKQMDDTVPLKLPPPPSSPKITSEE